MAKTDPVAILRAFDSGAVLPEPFSADPAFDLDAAYAVEAELVRLRRAEGRRTAGLKIGFANRAVWRALKLETLVWAHVYDHTVHQAPDNHATLSIGSRIAPKIEPEIVFRLAGPIAPGGGAAEALAAVNGMALGFEIIDCPFPGWTFQPPDLVAASGFHVALVIGEWVSLAPAALRALEEAPAAPREDSESASAGARASGGGAPRALEGAPAAPREDSESASAGARASGGGAPRALEEKLAIFTVTLSKNGTVIETGSGKNVLKSPALCLAELATAISRRRGAEPLGAGEFVTTGSLTTAQPVATGDVWRAEVAGLDLPPLTLTFV